MEDRLLKNRLGYFLLFMVSILYIGCYYPCFYNQFLLSEGFIGPKNCIFLSVIWAFFLFVFRKNKKICYPSPRFNKALVCLFFYLLFRVLFFNEESSISYINTIFVSWLLVFLNINTFTEKEYMGSLSKLLILMFISTLVGMALFLIFGGLPILGDIEINVEGHHILNFGFFFIKFGETWDMELIRPSGWFDEPGSFANVVLFFLIYNRLKIRSRKLELILLIGGCLSLSMAYFIIAVLYVLFFMMRKKDIGKFLLIIGVLFVFYVSRPQEGLLYNIWDYSFGRMERIVEGNDGSRDYNYAFKAFEKYYLTGQNDEIIKKEFEGITLETIWFTLANHGIVGILFYYIPFLLVFLNTIGSKIIKKDKKKDNILLLILLGVNLLQRPIYLFPLYILLIYYIWFDDERISSGVTNQIKIH